MSIAHGVGQKIQLLCSTVKQFVSERDVLIVLSSAGFGKYIRSSSQTLVKEIIYRI